MGSLSNLYISQSYQSLAHLGTNAALVPGTMNQLQDGIGQSLNISFDGTNISSSGNIYGANITGSSINTGSFVSTASFNAYTASNDSKVNQLINATSSYAISSSVAAVDAAQQLQINSLISATGSYVTSSVPLTSLNAYTQSNDTKWNTLGGQTGSYVTSAITASSLVTASVNLNTITFTKGDASTFNITVNTGSGGGTTDITSLNAFTSSQQALNTTFATTGSNTFIGNQNIYGTTNFISGSTQFRGNQVSVESGSGVTKFFVNNSVGLVRSLYPLEVQATFTASLQQGYVWVGNAGDVSTLVATSSFFSSGSGPTDISSLNAFTASQFVSNSFFATTGSNTFVGNQTLTGSLFVSGNINMVNGADIVTHHVKAPAINGVEIQTNTGGVVALFGAGGGLGTTFYGQINGTSISASTINGLGDPLAFSTSVDSRLDGLEAATSSYVTSAITASSLVTASFSGNTLTFTKGDSSTFGVVIPDVSGSTINTGSFATTGSNVFTGDQTLVDPAGNSVTLSDVSGSLMLVAKSFTSASSHITASTSTQVNLIFKNNDNTGDTIISGSNNIFVNATTASAGFKRYIGGNGSIAPGPTHLPQISASMAFPVTMNNNILNSSNGLTMRGPVSSSTWTISTNYIAGAVNIGTSAGSNAEKIVSGLALSTNTIAGTLNIVANREFLTSSLNASLNNINGTVTLNLNSSSATFTNNTIIDTSFTFTNNFYSGSVGLGAARFNRNLVVGQSNTMLATGISDAVTLQAAFDNNIIGGISNTLFINATGASTNNQLNNTIIYGNTLIVTGSSNTTTTFGGAFFGRYNANDGVRNSSGGTILAIGTGTAAGARKTGFLIDSGSNTFVEGTFNVSGSSSFNGNVNITGSLLVNGVAPVIPVGTVSSSAQIVAYNIFATTGSNSFNGNQTITGSLILSSSATTELIVIGNSEFTGSVNGNVVSMSITSNTASMNFNLGNYFELTASVSPVRIEVSNLSGGTTKTLALNGVTSSTINFSSNVLQPSGSAYTASVSGSNDILSFVAFNSNRVNVVSTLKMI